LGLIEDDNAPKAHRYSIRVIRARPP